MSLRIPWACGLRPGLREQWGGFGNGYRRGRWGGQKATGQEVLVRPCGEGARAQHEHGEAITAPGGTRRPHLGARPSAERVALRAPGRFSSGAAHHAAVTAGNQSSGISPGHLSSQGVSRPGVFAQNVPEVRGAGVPTRDGEAQTVRDFGGWSQAERGVFPLSFPQACLPLASHI